MIDFTLADDIVQLSCGKTHIFHKNCIYNWIIKGRTKDCPYCRKKINTNDLNKN